jgi:hypothetical protein
MPRYPGYGCPSRVLPESRRGWGMVRRYGPDATEPSFLPAVLEVQELHDLIGPANAADCPCCSEQRQIV